ncbi:hypothetical protein DJ564_07605 [Pseudomonas sp. 31-12]|uniref:hypothetical protein n=1 Tax=Pseudomonas sp. 31-12 TaxID=2201356 RepID=UPI000D6D7535|nr:hypothetical protein [Pseudomonas sp. 31-12]AWM90699.1 hypothetical protein DJ564_07605 [Pseudomonas sp. 31-12]
MHNCAKTVLIIFTTLAFSPYGFAKYGDYKTIDESDNINDTTIHYYIKNLTSEELTLSRPSQKQTDRGNAISDFTVPINAVLNFPTHYPEPFRSITRDNPRILTETFAYASGKKECQFTATIKVTDLLKPAHWSGNGKSIGVEPADCTTDIFEVISTLPYSYSIQFSLE